MIRAALFVLLCLATPLAAQAERLVMGLSKDEVQINTDFNGSELLIFGAIKREKPLPDGPPLEVIVTVEGPLENLTVFRKERIAGIWVNADSLEIDRAPSFYAIATSGPFNDIISRLEDLRLHITIPRTIRSVGTPGGSVDASKYREAVIRIRREKGLYQRLEGIVDIEEQTLFRTNISLPSSLTEGTYQTRIFLIRDKRVVSQISGEIDVSKVGLERWLYNLSQMQPVIYGILSLAIAALAGWAASSAARLLNRS